MVSTAQPDEGGGSGEEVEEFIGVEGNCVGYPGDGCTIGTFGYEVQLRNQVAVVGRSQVQRGNESEMLLHTSRSEISRRSQDLLCVRHRDQDVFLRRRLGRADVYIQDTFGTVHTVRVCANYCDR